MPQVGQDHRLPRQRACRPAAKPSIAPAYALRPYDSCGCDVPQFPWLRAGNGQIAARQRAEPPRQLAAGLGHCGRSRGGPSAGRGSVGCCDELRAFQEQSRNAVRNKVFAAVWQSTAGLAARLATALDQALVASEPASVSFSSGGQRLTRRDRFARRRRYRRSATLPRSRQG